MPRAVVGSEAPPLEININKNDNTIKSINGIGLIIIALIK